MKKTFFSALSVILLFSIASCRKENTSVQPGEPKQNIKNLSKATATAKLEIAGMGFWAQDGRGETVCFPSLARCWEIVISSPRHLDMVGEVTSDGTVPGDFTITSADNMTIPVTYFTPDGPITNNVMSFAQTAGDQYNSISRK